MLESCSTQGLVGASRREEKNFCKEESSGISESFHFTLLGFEDEKEPPLDSALESRMHLSHQIPAIL